MTAQAPGPEDAGLLPCPFCGGTDLVLDIVVNYVFCNKCTAEGPWVLNGDDDRAVAAWNRRTPPTAVAPAENAGDRERELVDVLRSCVDELAALGYLRSERIANRAYALLARCKGEEA